MKKQARTIGHVDHGKTALDKAIDKEIAKVLSYDRFTYDISGLGKGEDLKTKLLSEGFYPGDTVKIVDSGKFLAKVVLETDYGEPLRERGLSITNDVLKEAKMLNKVSHWESNPKKGRLKTEPINAIKTNKSKRKSAKLARKRNRK